MDFETTILDHLRHHKPTKLKGSHTPHIPIATILFTGICIGTALAAHALLLSWGTECVSRTKKNHKWL